jgi:hypothetical protein
MAVSNAFDIIDSFSFVTMSNVIIANASVNMMFIFLMQCKVLYGTE